MINLQEQVGSKGSIRTTKGYHCTTHDTLPDMLNSTDGNIQCRVELSFPAVSLNLFYLPREITALNIVLMVREQ